MDELILYLEGKAPDPLIKRIERQRAEDEEFHEEMEEWEARIQEEGDKDSFIRQMRMIEHAWHDTVVPNQREKKIIFPRWIPLAVAAGFALLLLTYLLSGPFQKDAQININQQLAQDLNSKVSLLIGPEAAIGDGKTGQDLKQEVWVAFEQGDFELALEKVDSLIKKDPVDLNHVLLKALIYEKYGQSQEALNILDGLSSNSDQELIVSCESLWYQCLILGKQGEKGLFGKKAETWKESRCGELDKNRLEQLNHIEKSI